MKLTKLRKAKGLSRVDVARGAGVSEVTLWRLETGRRTGSVDVLRRIAAFLEVSLEDLIEDAA
jgi:transcriptional regulator with XRE-family HTH domain